MFTGKEIREKRESLRMSAATLAAILKTTKENVYKWEGGTKPSKHEDVISIESWLNGQPETIRESNGVDWKVKYEGLQMEHYELLKKYTALLEKMK